MIENLLNINCRDTSKTLLIYIYIPGGKKKMFAIKFFFFILFDVWPKICMEYFYESFNKDAEGESRNKSEHNTDYGHGIGPWRLISTQQLYVDSMFFYLFVFYPKLTQSRFST